MKKQVNPNDYKMVIGPLKIGQRVIALTTSGIVKYRGTVVIINTREEEATIKRDDGRKSWNNNRGWEIRHKWTPWGTPTPKNKYKWNVCEGIFRNDLYFDEVTNWKEYFKG